MRIHVIDTDYSFPAHRDAATKAIILHRDILLRNNMIVLGTIQAYWPKRLADFAEWSKNSKFSYHPLLKINLCRRVRRQGSFQFISARLLMQTTKVHHIGDDLESFIYVLTMVAIKGRYEVCSEFYGSAQLFLRVWKSSTIFDGVGAEQQFHHSYLWIGFF